MVVIAVPAFLTALVGFATSGLLWVASLPREFKYILFLGGLLLDLPHNVIGGGINVIFSLTLDGLNLGITSFQLLILFIILPIAFTMFKQGL